MCRKCWRESLWNILLSFFFSLELYKIKVVFCLHVVHANTVALSATKSKWRANHKGSRMFGILYNEQRTHSIEYVLTESNRPTQCRKPQNVVQVKKIIDCGNSRGKSFSHPNFSERESVCVCAAEYCECWYFESVCTRDANMREHSSSKRIKLFTLSLLGSYYFRPPYRYFIDVLCVVNFFCSSTC